VIPLGKSIPLRAKEAGPLVEIGSLIPTGEWESQGLTKRNNRSGALPRSRQVAGWNNALGAGLICSEQWTYLGTWVQGKKGIAENHAPVSRRKLISHLLNCNNSPVLLSLYWGHRCHSMGGPGSHHCSDGCALYSAKNQGQYAFQSSPLQMGQGPWGCLFLQGHSLWKWSPCSHWKQVYGFGPDPEEATLRAAISAHYCLPFFFYFSRSLL
jgi:hypothetical protein